jgi:integrase
MSVRAATSLLPVQTGFEVSLRVNLVRREFKPAPRRAKLPEIRFHDLRYSFASLRSRRASTRS